MRHFPIFLDLADRLAVVIGGGEVAARKVALLASAGAAIRVVAPTLCERLAEAAQSGRIDHIAKPFEPTDLDGAWLCIAATGAVPVNAAVAAAAHALRLPVNVVDDPALCSFIMPAIVDRGPITVAISSGGVSPVLARLLRARLTLALPARVAELAELATAWRDRIRAALPDAGQRRRFWEDFFDRATAGSARAPDPIAWLARTEAPAEAATVRVAIADPDLITLRDLRRIRDADVVFHDTRLAGLVLDQARRDAETVAIEIDDQNTMTRADALATSGRRVVVVLAATAEPTDPPTGNSAAPD